MKTKIWVLSTCAPGSDEPCLPEVFTSAEAADARFAEWMQEEWEHFGAEDAGSGERAPFPADPLQAHEIMLSLNDMEDKRRFGGWEITTHEMDVPIPQALRDLVTLAAGLEAFQSDERMNAALRACEALVGGAEASPAPAEPDPWQAAVDALQAEHGGFWGQHRLYTRSDWQDEVDAGDTQRGYWDWVAAMLEQEEDDEFTSDESTCAEVKAAHAAEVGGADMEDSGGELGPLLEMFPSFLREAVVSMEGGVFKVSLHTSNPEVSGDEDSKA